MLGTANSKGVETMLVLTRNVGESIVIMGCIHLTLARGDSGAEWDLKFGNCTEHESVRVTRNMADKCFGVRILTGMSTGSETRVGISLPKNIPVYRGEIWRRIQAQKGVSA